MRKRKTVLIGNIAIGGNNPIIVQSMTDTDTSNIEASVNQVIELADAGSEIVRLTINNDEAAYALPHIKDKLLQKNYHVPLVGCFHYNGHKLLSENPSLCEALDKFRINPGNVGFGNKRDKQFDIMIEAAIKYNKPIRIGVNWGSIDKDLSAELMNNNSKLTNPKSANDILHDILIMSALMSARRAEDIGLSSDKIVISCKTSRVQDLIKIYRELNKKADYALHLGLTEAGMGIKGAVATSVALSVLLQENIGDTIRASLTPAPGTKRTEEVTICRQILQSMGFRYFEPQVSACPGCGRTTSIFFRQLAFDIQNFIKDQMPQWKISYPGVENMNIAVMGCIVNGPGESKHADIGISLPGSGEVPMAPVFIDGKRKYILRGENIANDFKNILFEYINSKYKILVN